jgi:hypothetical protein
MTVVLINIVRRLKQKLKKNLYIPMTLREEMQHAPN